MDGLRREASGSTMSRYEFARYFLHLLVISCRITRDIFEILRVQIVVELRYHFIE